MTDEIRITRRVALPDKYEYYEIEWKGDDVHKMDDAIKLIESHVDSIRLELGKPRPEISPKIEEYVQPATGVREPEPADQPLWEKVEYSENGRVAKAKGWLGKEAWKEINAYLKGMGYKWIAEKENSRWEKHP